ncbi:MAG: hypothetical protein FWH14_08410 [Oscillospiraceae bacterium]|nr:hypothetical protein [Oscillospiraceae bacterium]
MVNTKVNIDIKQDETVGERLLAAIKRKGIPHKTVEVNKKGHIIVDREKDPDLYDWAVNG